MNIINGGVHANNSLRIQEFMVRPEKPETFSEAVRICFLIIQNLKNHINDKNLSTTVGDEGGFALALKNNEEAIEFIIKSIEKTISHMEPGSDSLITVYWGDHSKINQSELENKLIDLFSSIEMEFQYGGQSNIEAWVVIE